ncbi:MAG: thiamine phosphate synthase [Betaproteobacteria bacterium]
MSTRHDDDIAPRNPIHGLYAITPDETDTSKLLRAVSDALEGGARLVQYRNKSARAALAHDQALALREIVRNAGAAFIVNDDLELALAVLSDGVHLGRDDMPGHTLVGLDDLRKRAARTRGAEPDGHRFIIGISCYNDIELARSASEAGADYVAFGSMFPSSTKPAAMRAPLSLIAEARRRFTLPVVAIGGITVENAPQLIEAGVNAVAVISALFDAKNVVMRARQFTSLFDKHV